MFGHATAPPSLHNTPSRLYRSQVSSSDNRRSAVPVQVRTPSLSPQRGRSPSPVQKQPRPSAKVSEQYTNREYNRQPSPLSRFQRPGSTSGKPEDPPRPRTASRPRLQRATPSVSRSDVLRQRALETHCSRPVRPRTAEPRGGKPLKACPSMDNRVLLTVKEVLSRAVFEKGRIDENNIETILHDMQTRLNIDNEEEKEEEEPRTCMDLEKKTSKTSVNVNSSTESVLLRKQNAFGFVRRQLEPPTKRPSTGYRKIYPPEKKPQSGAHFGEEDDNVVYVDLPDPDYSNFNSLVATRKAKSKSNELKAEVAEQEKHAEEMVGDYKPKDHSSEMWRSAEDAKLQKYIESLIKNMNNQLSGDHTARIVEDEIKENTFCKSICVCKVCVSNRTCPNTAVKPRDPQVEVRSVKHSSSKSRSSVKNSNVSLDKSSNTESTTRMKFRVLKKNQNFQPESKICISSRPLVNNPSTKSFTVDEEAGEDLYLQKRISRAPTGRRAASRM